MLYSKYCEYAIKALSYLAMYKNDNRYIMVREISEKTNIPQHFLSKIFQDLTTTHWVSSKKGKHGGFVIAVDCRKLTLMDVIKWSDGIHNFNQCILGDKKCGDDFECNVHRKCCKLRMDIADFFDNMTIHEYSDIGTEALEEANK